MRKLSRLCSVTVTSFCMQLEKWGRGLLRKARRGEGERAFGWKGLREKGEWKMEVNTGVLAVHSPFSPLPFEPKSHSLATRQASRSRTHPHFSKCMQNDVTAALHSLDDFHQKTYYLLTSVLSWCSSVILDCTFSYSSLAKVD